MATVSGFDIRIWPRANLVRSDKDRVYGMVATAKHRELDRLYAHAREVLGETYLPEAVVAKTLTGEDVPALCYIAPGYEARATRGRLHRIGSSLRLNSLAFQAGMWTVFAVSADDLHYVSYVDPAFRFVSVDLLADRSLLPFFKNITQQERRDHYEQIGRRLNFIVARLNHSLKAVLSGRLTRAVLDVEEGAIYYYSVGNTPFVLGVTLDQDRVTQADARMENLARKIQASTVV